MNLGKKLEKSRKNKYFSMNDDDDIESSSTFYFKIRIVFHLKDPEQTLFYKFNSFECVWRIEYV